MALDSSVETMPKRIEPAERKPASVYWHADSWLPPKYKEAGFITGAMRYALSKQGLRCPGIRACLNNPSVFSDDLVERYVNCRVYPVNGECEEERLKVMLASLVGSARDRGSFVVVVVVASLSRHTGMITRVLGSLMDRGYDVVLALPEVDEDKAKKIGIRICTRNSGRSLPVWVCPDLFDEALPLEAEATTTTRFKKDGDEEFFIQLPHPQTTTFSMPTNVNTCVLWDVKDFPVPRGLDYRTFVENIKSAVHCSGDVSIYTYGVAEELESLPLEYLHAGNTLVEVPADQVSRSTVMMVDFVLYSMGNRKRPPLVSNILVISKEKTKDMFSAVLVGLKIRRFNVFVAMPDDFPPPSPCGFSSLPWKSLCRQNREADTVSACDV